MGAVNHTTPWYPIHTSSFPLYSALDCSVPISFICQSARCCEKYFLFTSLFTDTCSSYIHLQFTSYLVLCCLACLPIFSVCLAVHMLFVCIDSSASWLCIMCLPAPHVSCRICQLSSYDLSCTRLQHALVKRHEWNPAAGCISNAWVAALF